MNTGKSESRQKRLMPRKGKQEKDAPSSPRMEELNKKKLTVEQEKAAIEAKLREVSKLANSPN